MSQDGNGAGAACCQNPQPIEEFRKEVRARVTTCVACGSNIDYQQLRPQDEPSGENDPLVDQTPRRPAWVPPPPQKAKPDRTETTRTPAPPPRPVCKKHGGTLEPCSIGPGHANLCANSRWGERRVCDGPCSCVPCHKRPDDHF